MTYILPSDGTASEMFFDSMQDRYGSPYTWCNCNIDHYAVDRFDEDDRDFDPSDLPEESDTVKHHPGESIESCQFDGQTFVWECEGCRKRLRRYEDFMWRNRDTYRDYLKTRVDQEKRWADQEHTRNLLAGIE